MEVLVVTGGIGSGKSEVCAIIRDEFSCGVYEADVRVRNLYVSHPTLLSEIESGLGLSCRDASGNFCPGTLSGRIFSDRRALETVESMVFPVLMEDFKEWCKDYDSDCFVVFESATVLEKPQFEGFADKVIVVDAPFDVRVERACRRDCTSEEAVRDRMMNQKLMNRVSEGFVPEGADAVIRNTGSLTELREAAVRTIKDLFNITNFKYSKS